MKQSYFATHPTLRKAFLGACLLGGLVVLAVTFGPDETREFARDVAVKFGIVDQKPAPTEETRP